MTIINFDQIVSNIIQHSQNLKADLIKILIYIKDKYFHKEIMLNLKTNQFLFNLIFFKTFNLKAFNDMFLLTTN